MSDRTWASNAVVEGLLEWGIEDFTYVPSSHIAPVVRPLQEQGVRSYLAAREEEGVGLAGGLVLGGRKAALLMQDNGFGNAPRPWRPSRRRITSACQSSRTPAADRVSTTR